ncbi:MAG: hypothetical protein N3G21_05975 [Candidatus Hydrogenedentes bacterium]|nr:hypothetical protein [Candidatus Hydrogenedentota bacterium]
MKVEDFAYQVALRTIELLEQEQHYKVSEEHRKAVLQKIISEVPQLLKKGEKKKEEK